MNESVYQRLLETARRRELTADERARLEACLARDPAAREAWREEVVLTRLLNRLPAPPLPPDFASRVVSAVEREEALAGADRGSWWARFRVAGLRWRLAGAAATVAVAVLAVQLQHRAAERARLAEGLAAFSALAEVPGVEALADFDLVYSLPDGPLPEDQGLARALE
jgi:anti-sigma factor RsiW